MNIENRIRGKRSKSLGAMFEKGLENVFSRLAQRGVACIMKTPEPLKVLPSTRRGHVFNAVFTEKAQPDYTGTLRGGRSVMIEAKATETDRITQDRVLASQAALLDKHSRLGAVCGVIVCLNFEAYGYIPWEAWKELKKITGHKYVNAADLKQQGWALNGNDIARELACHLEIADTAARIALMAEEETNGE